MSFLCRHHQPSPRCDERPRSGQPCGRAIDHGVEQRHQQIEMHLHVRRLSLSVTMRQHWELEGGGVSGERRSENTGGYLVVIKLTHQRMPRRRSALRIATGPLVRGRAASWGNDPPRLRTRCGYPPRMGYRASPSHPKYTYSTNLRRRPSRSERCHPRIICVGNLPP